MIECKIYEEDPGASWDDFVRQHKRRNPFQTRSFFYMYQHTNEFTPYFCIAKHTQSNKILGGFLFVIQKKRTLILHHLFSRALIVGGPLIPAHGQHILQELLATYSKFIRSKVIYSEIRNLHQWQHFYDTFLKAGFTYEAHLNYQVDLQKEDITTNFSASKKRQIKKGLQNGAYIIQDPTIEQVRDFYAILKNLYKVRINKPLPNWSFFESFYVNIVKKALGKYILVGYNNQIIGGIMMPLYNGKMTYEWYVAGEDRKHKYLYPSVLATWAGIKFAQEHNYSGFDFMGAGKPNVAYGVREFKSRFGGKLLNYGRFYKKHKRLIYFLMQKYIQFKHKKN